VLPGILVQALPFPSLVLLDRTPKAQPLPRGHRPAEPWADSLLEWGRLKAPADQPGRRTADLQPGRLSPQLERACRATRVVCSDSRQRPQASAARPGSPIRPWGGREGSGRVLPSWMPLPGWGPLAPGFRLPESSGGLRLRESGGAEGQGPRALPLQESAFLLAAGRKRPTAVARVLAQLERVDRAPDRPRQGSAFLLAAGRKRPRAVAGVLAQLEKFDRAPDRPPRLPRQQVEMRGVPQEDRALWSPASASPWPAAPPP